MYDMYPWDSASQGDYPPEPLRSWRNPGAGATPREASPAEAVQAVQAVQVALDRRDNGGAAIAARQSAARQPASPQPASPQPAGPLLRPPSA